MEDSRLKLVQINSVFGRGSTGKIVKDIHEAAQLIGIDSHVFFGRGNRQNDSKVKRINTKIGVYWHYFLSRLFDHHGLSSKVETFFLIKHLKKIKPDIIHLHNIHGYYLNYKMLFEYIVKDNIRVIWTLHDCWAYTGHCAYYSYKNCEKWASLCMKCPQLGSYPKSIIDKSTRNFSYKKTYFSKTSNMLLVTPSYWLNFELKKSFLAKYPSRVINNGVNTNVFYRRNSNLRDFHNINDKFIILGVANVWDSRKGLQYFIELSKMIDESAVIILIGLNNKQINRIGKNIIGLSRTDSQIQLAEYYSIANVYVNPTLEDNYPTTNIEALSCNTPVITFDTGGSPEIINNNGIIVKEKSAEAIYREIDNIKKKRISFIFNDYAKYDKKNSVERYLNLYSERGK